MVQPGELANVPCSRHRDCIYDPTKQCDLCGPLTWPIHAPMTVGVLIAVQQEKAGLIRPWWPKHDLQKNRMQVKMHGCKQVDIQFTSA